MKELTDRLQLMLVEARELEVKMKEFRDGLKEQVDTILAGPPPRFLFNKHKQSLAAAESRFENNAFQTS